MPYRFISNISNPNCKYTIVSSSFDIHGNNIIKSYIDYKEISFLRNNIIYLISDTNVIARKIIKINEPDIPHMSFFFDPISNIYHLIRIYSIANKYSQFYAPYTGTNLLFNFDAHKKYDLKCFAIVYIFYKRNINNSEVKGRLDIKLTGDLL